MANLNKLFTLGWQSAYGDDDIDINFSSNSTSIKKIVVANPTGNGFITSVPGEILQQFENFESVTGYYIQLNSGQSANVQNIVNGTAGGDEGRVTTLYPSSFVLDPVGLNEEYLMTTKFENGRPVYRKSGSTNQELSFNGTEYVGDLPMMDGNTLVNREFKNGSCLPNAPYSRTGQSDYVTDSHFVEISGFDGDKANLNGSYYEVGHIHGEKTYRHSGCVDWYYYKSANQWVLTDTPYNGTGCYINGVVDKFGCVDASNGHNCFSGQRACVFDGDVDPRSLTTESDTELKLLRTESATEVRVLITEFEL